MVGMTDAGFVFLGTLLILAGYELFWLGIGVIGFMAGAYAATAWLSPAYPQGIGLVFAVLCGLLGIIIASGFEWVMIMLLGFWAGGVVFQQLFVGGFGDVLPFPWLFIAGGITGIIMAAMAFDWILIGFSSCLGATLIMWHLPLDEFQRGLVLVSLAGLGILIQSFSVGKGILRKKMAT